MMFIGTQSERVIEMLAEKNGNIKKAYDILQIISKDEKARMLYEAREAELKDQVTRMMEAEQKGNLKGKLEGKLESKRDVALKMLDMGIRFKYCSEGNRSFIGGIGKTKKGYTLKESESEIRNPKSGGQVHSRFLA